MQTDESLRRQEQELLEQLEILRREKELKEKLAAIRQQLDNANNGRTNDENVGRRLIPKGSWDWERYVIFVVATLGRCKSIDVKKYVEDSNPTLDYDTIDNAVSGKLSSLFKDGKISAEPGGSRKEGYTYYVTEEQKKHAKID